MTPRDREYLRNHEYFLRRLAEVDAPQPDLRKQRRAERLGRRLERAMARQGEPTPTREPGHAPRKRCGARVKNILKVSRSGAMRAAHPFCRAWALAGKTRCRLHGGYSTGPKTEEGMARTVVAMKEGRRKWVERMKAEGRKFTCGRRPGSQSAILERQAPPTAESSAAPADALAKAPLMLAVEHRRQEALAALDRLEARLGRK